MVVQSKAGEFQKQTNNLDHQPSKEVRERIHIPNS
jgi:hypothetical protein